MALKEKNLSERDGPERSLNSFDVTRSRPRFSHLLCISCAICGYSCHGSEYSSRIFESRLARLIHPPHGADGINPHSFQRVQYYYYAGTSLLVQLRVDAVHFVALWTSSLTFSALWRAPAAA
jgi:hypothetical protein